MLVAIALFLTTAVVSATTPVQHKSTPDEATVDEATPDEATTVATREPTVVTEEPTEEPTDAPIVQDDELDEQYEDPEKEPEETGAATTTEAQASYSTGDLEWLARTICMEAGNCSEYCQWLVGSTALNLADRFNGGDLEATVTNPNMFAVADCFYLREPSVQNWAVAERLLSGDRDYVVMAFRTDYYHDFGTPYTVVDNVYFSTY